jgi:hypothetical protein
VVFLEHLFRDLRDALRQLLKSPGFTLTAVLTLAFGIGATTAIFSIVEGVLLRPLPFADPARLVTLGDTVEGADYGGDALGVTGFPPKMQGYFRDGETNEHCCSVTIQGGGIIRFRRLRGHLNQRF